MKVPAGMIVGGRIVVGAWPGATGRGAPTVGNGWKKKLLEGFGFPGLTGVGVGARGVVAVITGLVGVGGRAAGVDGLGDGEGDAEGEGKFNG